MSIHAPEYDRPPPALLPARDRTFAIFEQGFRERLGALNIVLLAFIFLVVLLPLGFAFYLPTAFFGAGVVDLQLFYVPYGLEVGFFFLVLLASSVGAGVVAGDVATRTLTLYLARPIRRLDYLLAKTGVVGLWMVLGALVPGCLGTVIVLALGYVSLPLALQGAAGFLLVGLLSAIAFTALALLLSTLTARSTVAGAGIFGALVGSQAVVLVVAGISRQDGFRYLSPEEDLLAVARAAFQVSGNPIDPWAAGAVLLAFSAVAFLIAYGRLRGAEVVGE